MILNSRFKDKFLSRPIMLKIRKYAPADLQNLIDLFKQTVQNINIADYTKEQIEAWISIDPTVWAQTLAENIALVAEIEGKIVGFADLRKDGLVDRLYVDQDYQGQGIAKALMKELETEAKKLNLQSLRTYASITAKPFFEKIGFETVYENKVGRQGIELTNYFMQKGLINS